MKQTMSLWRKTELLIALSTHLFEDHIISQMIPLDGDIADKIEDYIERIHQRGKCLERRYQCVTDFTQSQTAHIWLQDLLYNSIVEVK